MGDFFRSFWWLLFLFLFGVVGLSFFTKQEEFYKILLFYIPMFLGYAYVVKSADASWLNHLLIFGVLLRFILLFAFPFLSDDVFRFIWDGRLWQQGINPFNHLPTHFMLEGNQVAGLDQALFDKLNSPEYFTIYPPLNQIVFYLSTVLAGSSIWWSAFLMKTFLFASEVGTIFLLPKVLKNYGIEPKNALIYVLNPLIIIEVCGNMHFEGMMVFFLLVAIHFLKKEKFWQSAIAFALSVASKLLPLIFLPFLLKKYGFKKTLIYGSIVGITLVLLYIPMINQTFINNFSNSLNLYFQKFEFNASIYYVARWVGYQRVGWNMIAKIGPQLAMLSSLSIVLLAIFKTNKNSILPQKWMWAIMIYLLCTTTVHPWYVALPLFLCCFSNFRFPMLWSALICLTYINYSYGDYFENLWIVALEYLVVFGFMIWEIFNKERMEVTTLGAK